MRRHRLNLKEHLSLRQQPSESAGAETVATEGGFKPGPCRNERRRQSLACRMDLYFYLSRRSRRWNRWDIFSM